MNTARPPLAHALSVALAFVLALSSARGVHAQGIPVLDASNLAQAFQQVAYWQRQITAMREQHAQLTRQVDAMTGSRGFSELLKHPELQAALPREWLDVYTQLQRGSLTPEAAALRLANKIYDCEGRAGDELTQCRRVLAKPYQDKADTLRIYDQALAKVGQINGLMSEISRTQDPKSIAELQARLQVEALVLQNQTNQLQLYTRLSQIEDQLIQQQERERRLLRDANTRRTVDTLQPQPFNR